MMRIWLVAGMAALTACATTNGGNGGAAGGCDADAAQTLIGEQASSALGQRALALSGARTLRWIPPDSAVTLDYRPDRLNIEYNRENTVTEIGCG